VWLSELQVERYLMNVAKIAAFGLLMSFCASVYALIPVPLANINASIAGSEPGLNPGAMIEFNGHLYFSAPTPDLGTELFRVPVNGMGAELVKDIAPGSLHSHPQQFVVAGNTLFFFASNGYAMYLWTTDGTAAGTRRVKRVTVDQTTVPVAMGNAIYFAGYDANGEGTELWKSDGTSSGTTRWDIKPGSASSYPKDLTVSGNVLYFSANDGNQHLWKTDGTSLVNLTSGLNTGSVSPQDITAFGTSSAVFWGWTSTTTDVWITDGTTTTSLHSAPSLLSVLDLNATNGVIFFARYTEAYTATNKGLPRLYSSDGTPSGTVLRDINPGVPTDVSGNFVPAGSLMYFYATSTVSGQERWVIDTTTFASTQLELTPGSAGTAASFSVGNGAGQLFFSLDDGTGKGTEPWISDGTLAGTKRVKDVVVGSGDGLDRIFPVVMQNNGFLFLSQNELWRTDGSDPGTQQLTFGINYGSAGSDPGNMVTSGGAGFFCATDAIHGRELWRTDGTESGTYRIHDLRVGGGSGCTGNWIVAAGGYLYFYGTDGSNTGLWKSDGVSAAPVFIKALSVMKQVVAIGNNIYFRGDDGSGAGEELWYSDGSMAQLLKDIYPGPISSGIWNLTALNSQLVFTANDNVHGIELWISDGTSAGTQLLANIAQDFVGSPPQSSSPGNLAVIGNRLYFSADNKTDGKEPWISDGTTAGTTIIDDIGAGTAGSNAYGFTGFGAYVYFSADDTVRGVELYRTTGAGASIIELVPGVDGSYPGGFTVAGNLLYFNAENSATGTELWKTDGTTVAMVKDILTGPDGSSPSELFPTGAGDSIYFTAYINNDQELWISDGSASGTRLLADLNPVERSYPGGFFSLGSQVVFRATTPDSGQELWTFGEADCGDAPDPLLSTLIVNAGACHKHEASNSLWLGGSRDADPDGQPSGLADGDDNDGTDDEDGVVLVGDFVIGQMAQVSVTLQEAGTLNAWVDWQANGNWSDSLDRAIYNLRLDAGTHQLSIAVPADSDIRAGNVNARFRVTSFGISSAEGIYIDGEVEDYQIPLIDYLDYGDAPAPYPTTSAANGAVHRLTNGVYLGASVDRDNDGQPSPNADGDDADGSDDEDGITFNNALMPGMNADIDAQVSVDGYLNAWIDFNRDGDWDDAGEMIINDEWVAAGSNTVSFSVPGAAANGFTYARFRFDSDGWLQPTGFAPDGEVEDYRVLVGSNQPLANAGVDHVLAAETEPVVLGAQPTATEGTPPYSYSWVITPGTAGVDYDLSSGTVANPVFTGYTENTYTATLTVTDSLSQTDQDNAVLTVVAFPDNRDILLPTLTGTHSYGACQQITADSVVIVDGADITLIAPVVILGPGFRVEANAQFRIITATPAECAP
jgi:ELWxxDGT repeat protein